MTEEAVLAAIATGTAVMALGGDPRPVALLTSWKVPAAPDVRIGAIGKSIRARYRALRRKESSDRALIEAVGVMVEHLRSGGSVDDGIVAVGQASDGDLIGSAFERLGDRLALGVGFGDAIDAWADEVGSVDARLVAATLVMHRRSGGSLAPILQRVIDTLGERLETEAEIRSLTAQARLSAWIVGSLPIGFLLFLTVISGPSIVATFLRPAGMLVLAVGIALEAAAVIWMRRILDVSR